MLAPLRYPVVVGIIAFGLLNPDPAYAPTFQTNKTRKPAEKRSYDAFGARRNPQWGAAPVAFSSLTTRGFTGHEDDEELGLVNMKGRLYDPKVGRFLTTDRAPGKAWERRKERRV